MIKFLSFIVFIFEVGAALAVDRELGHPLFRTFNAHDYGEVGQVSSVTEDPQGRMLFGARNAVVAFETYRWETIPAPGVGYIRSLAVDSHGVIWSAAARR